MYFRGQGLRNSLLFKLSAIKEYPELNRKITDREYDEVVNYAISIGVENGFIQDGETAMESFIPEFNGYTGE